MANIVVVSFRLGGTDGVSIEAAKWIAAMHSLGHHVTTLAGSGTADTVMPSLAIRASDAPHTDELCDAIDGADLVVVENLVSLPLNAAARDALYHALEGRRALFRHHDLPWQRPDSLDDSPPRAQREWRHVTINDLSRVELRDRGIEAVTVRNTFDCSPPEGRRALTRAALDVIDERLLLFPTRAIARKNVAGAFELAESLDAVLWLLGPAEDGYDETLNSLMSASSARVVTGLGEGVDIHDAYAACDLVVMPSTWEGFGNPVLESVTHRRPLAVYPYPVLEEIRSFGFRFFDLADLEGIASVLASPDDELFEHNAAIAEEHFNSAHLPSILSLLLEVRVRTRDK